MNLKKNHYFLLLEAAVKWNLLKTHGKYPKKCALRYEY
jgi:hypothetical protein